MSRKSQDKIFSSVRTLKTFNTELSFDDNEDRKKAMNVDDTT